MQRDSRLLSKKASRSRGYEVGGYEGACCADGAPFFGEDPTGMKHHEFPAPLNGVEFQPSETCPKNYVIFDQTHDKSRVMFHPSLAHNFGSSSFDIDGAHHAHEAGKSVDRDNGSKGEYPSPYIEDTDDIDALLSSEEEDDDDDDDDAVSTGRTPGNWGGTSFSDGMKGSKFNSTNASSSSSKTEREKMKKMVSTLRGIIPGGGEEMDTPAVLDEAVKYLKSLKVEVKKLGVQNFDS